MAEQVVINEKQKEVLSKIFDNSGKVELKEASIDKRSAKALEARGLVKLKENNKGIFVSITAKGKKALN